MSSGSEQRAADEGPGRACAAGGHGRGGKRGDTGGRKASRSLKVLTHLSFKREWTRFWIYESSGRGRDGVVDLGNYLRVTDLKNSYWGTFRGTLSRILNTRNLFSLLN